MRPAPVILASAFSAMLLTLAIISFKRDCPWTGVLDLVVSVVVLAIAILLSQKP